MGCNSRQLLRRKSASSSRRGFTLIELLVVIAIIGTLVAMLLPAVQMAREAARRNSCSINQKNLGLAVQQFVLAQKIYPGYRDTMNTNAGPVPVSWTVLLLPYLEQRNMFDKWKQGVFTSKYLDIMACPSDQQDQSKASTSYVVNCGLPDKNPFDKKHLPRDWPPYEGDTFAYIFPSDWPANGPFVARWEGALDVDRLQLFTEAGFFDGMTHTFLLSENLDATTWDAGGPTVSNNGYVKLADKVYNTPEIFNGFCWSGEMVLVNNAGNSVNPVNGFVSENGVATEMAQARPSSKHSGGVNMTFADGRTVFLSDNIDNELYSLLMTPEGRQCTPNGQAFIGSPDLTGAGFGAYATWRQKVGTSDKLR